MVDNVPPIRVKNPIARAKNMDCEVCIKALADYTDQGWLAWMSRCGSKQQKLINDIVDHCETCKDSGGLTLAEIKSYLDVMNLDPEIKAAAQEYVENRSERKRLDRHAKVARERIDSVADRQKRRDISALKHTEREVIRKQKQDGSAVRQKIKMERMNIKNHKQAYLAAEKRIRAKFYENLEPQRKAAVMATFVGDLENTKFIAKQYPSNKEFQIALEYLYEREIAVNAAYNDAVKARRAEAELQGRACHAALVRINEGYYNVNTQRDPARVVKQNLTDDTTACHFATTLFPEEPRFKVAYEELKAARTEFQHYKSPAKKKTPKPQPNANARGWFGLAKGEAKEPNRAQQLLFDNYNNPKPAPVKTATLKRQSVKRDVVVDMPPPAADEPEPDAAAAPKKKGWFGLW
uniref:Uncharacterized protein n=1 Tax=viral metagenome TaxID=1070528 RepID=A0A6C0CKN1_9ZZZZ